MRVWSLACLHYVMLCSPRMDTKRHVLKGDWVAYSNYDNQSRLNNQRNWGTRILFKVMDKILT